MTERLHFHFHALEKEMATHSNVPAWRIPGTGEPGGLPSLGSHRVGHNGSDLAAANMRAKDSHPGVNKSYFVCLGSGTTFTLTSLQGKIKREKSFVVLVCQ